MTKTKTPFFSMGAQGSVGESITAQKQRRETLMRTKPLPTDPYSLAQAYQRWLYEDYAYLWRQQDAATRAEYRTGGSRFHLTAFQYWMKYHLKNLPDIALWLKLDHISGGLLLDSSRNANITTNFGTSSITGAIDHASYFDGVNDYLIVASNPSLLFTSALTIELFFKLSNTGANQRFLANRIIPGFTNNWTIWVGATRLLFFTINTLGVSSSFFTPAIVNWDTLHHAMFTYIPGTTTIYLDGVAYTGAAITGEIDAALADIRIGEREDGLEDTKGYMDNIIIYNRVLDPTEALRHSLRRYP